MGPSARATGQTHARCGFVRPGARWRRKRVGGPPPLDRGARCQRCRRAAGHSAGLPRTAPGGSRAATWTRRAPICISLRSSVHYILVVFANCYVS